MKNIFQISFLYLLLVLFNHNYIIAQWTEIEPLPKQKNLSMNTFLKGTIYSFGGIGDYGGSITSETQSSWKFTGSQWTPIKNLPIQRSAGFAGAVNGKIYIIGGSYSIGNDLKVYFNNNVTEYDPSSNSYDSLMRQPEPSRYMAGAVVDDKIVLIGGEVLSQSGVNLKEESENSAIYDPISGSYDVIEGPYKCSKSVAGVVGNTIYVVGGSDDQTQYLKKAFKGTYSNGSITWSKIADYPVGVTLASGGVSNGKFYVCAGATGKSTINSCYYYDPSDDKWKTTYALPIINLQSSTNMPGDGNAMYYVSGFYGDKVFKFVDGGLSFPIGSISDTTVLLLAKTSEEKVFKIKVSNNGASTLQGAITTGVSWLTGSSSTLNVVPGSSTIFTFTAKNVTKGNYKTILKFGTNEKDRNEISVTVRFYVRKNLNPQKSKVLVEEFTSTGNPKAKDADKEILDLIESYGDEVVIAQYHIESGTPLDKLKTQEGDLLGTSFGIRTIPRASFNRFLFPSQTERMLESTTFDSWNGWAGTLLENIPEAPVSANIEELSYDDGDKSVNLTLGIETFQPLFSSSKFYVTAIVTEDNIKATQRDGSTTNSNYIHNHVVRTMAPSNIGSPIIFETNSIEDGVIIPSSKSKVKLTFNSKVLDGTKGKLILIVHRNENNKPAEILQTLVTDLQPELIDKPFDVTVRTATKLCTTGDTVVFQSVVSNKINQSYPIKITRINNQLPTSDWSSAIGKDDVFLPISESGPVSHTLNRLDTLRINLKVVAGSILTPTGQSKVTIRYSSPLATPSSVVDKIFTLKADGPIVSVEEEKSISQLSNMSLSPVPTKNLLNIKFKNQINTKLIIQILDLNSKIVISSLYNNGVSFKDISLDLSTVISGNYILNVSDGQNIVSNKLIIVK